MPGSTSDLYRAWLLNQLGLSEGSINDLESQIYSQTSLASNRRFATGAYYPQYNPGGGNATAVVPVLNDLNVFPFIVGQRSTFDRVATAVGALQAATFVKLGLYNSTEDNKPNVLLEESAQLDCSSVGTKEHNINRTLDPGLYWLAHCVQGAAIATLTFRGIGASWSEFVGFADPANNAAGQGYIQAAVAGALPNPFVHSFVNANVYTGSMPRIMMRST